MWKVIISAVLWIGITLALNIPLHLGDTTMPPLGRFFSPGAGFWQNAAVAKQSEKPQNIALHGINEEVRIVFDERLVPHIFAANDRDAYFAQGYVTAMYRLWQMDISTRAAAGQLSKVLGERTLKYDKSQRESGMGFAAENALKGWEKYPEDLAVIQSYSDGVNAYISSLHPREYPIEYKLLNYAPELWTPLRSAYFVKSMATRLCMQEDDLEHTLLRKWLGTDRFNALFPEHNVKDDPVIPPGTPWDFEPVAVMSDTVQQISAGTGGGTAQMQKQYHEGSNNWAVSGSRTASGKPLLCNDPHLELSLPSVWYELQIITPQQNVYGVSLAGMPGIIIGFNSDIAWGMTNVGQDVLDWYDIAWTDDTHTAYLLDGTQTQVTTRVETIDILGSDPVVDTVSYTIWGPVQKSGPHEGLAMRWLSHDIPTRREASMFVHLNHAKSHDEFATALMEFQTPAQNFVYADKLGNIALHIGGMLPLRHDHNGRFVQDGSHSKNGWSGSIPAQQNPYVLNPPRGFVSSANQETTDSTYPYIYFGGFEDFRGRILNRYLGQTQNASVADMIRIQNSTVSLKAEELLPHLLEATKSAQNGDSQPWQLLSSWKYDYTTESSAPVLFELWYDAFTEYLWDDFYHVKDSLYIKAPAAWRTNALVMNEPGSAEFDIDSTSAKETFGDLARLSFAEAIQEFANLDEEQRTWGGYRKTTVKHLANLPGFSRKISTSGHGDALNATTMTHGPSWRMIVDLSEPVKAFVVYPGGEDGNPASAYYDNMIETWQKGEYYHANYMTSLDEITPVRSLTIIASGK